MAVVPLDVVGTCTKVPLSAWLVVQWWSSRCEKKAIFRKKSADLPLRGARNCFMMNGFGDGLQLSL
jgi:hypothetical protein